MTDHVIQVEGLSKLYRIGGAPTGKSFREMIAGAADSLARRVSGKPNPQAQSREHWALRDVSFTVGRGEVVGIIGANGAGKSTLLKILSQITVPTQGRAVIRGRVASLLEVGTGFHPELTGRENIYLNGTILGMTRREIDARFNDIVEFSGIGQFLDTPVKNYSSGMAVRLAFAVAAHLEPEVLIVDEVLAVGDVSFQKKCIGKMGQVVRSGRTVLFVSHNMNSILQLCTSILFLEGGRGNGTTGVEEGVRRYLAANSADMGVPMMRRTRKISMTRAPQFAGLTLSVDGQPTTVVPCGSQVTVEIDLENLSHLRHGECGFIITNHQGQRVAAFQSQYNSDLVLSGKSRDRARLTCTIPSLGMVPGTYHIELIMADLPEIVDHVEEAARFEVIFADLFGTGRIPNATQAQVVLGGHWSLAA